MMKSKALRASAQTGTTQTKQSYGRYSRRLAEILDRLYAQTESDEKLLFPSTSSSSFGRGSSDDLDTQRVQRFEQGACRDNTNFLLRSSPAERSAWAGACAICVNFREPDAKSTQSQRAELPKKCAVAL